MSQQRLVVGDDGSAAADLVWQWVDHHRWPGWTISVVTADDRGDTTILPPDRITLSAWDPPTPRRLGHGSDDTRVEHLIGVADPRVVLDSVGWATLMAIGPRGTGLVPQRFGSTAEWLLERPDPPLVVVRTSRPTRSIVLDDDGSPHALRAARCLAELPWIAGCDVTLVTVQGHGARPDEAGEQTAAVLRAAGAAVQPLRVTGHRRVLGMGGDGSGAVLGAIDKVDPDLVAVSITRLAGLRSAFRAANPNAGPTVGARSVLVAFAPGGE